MIHFVVEKKNFFIISWRVRDIRKPKCGRAIHKFNSIFVWPCLLLYRVLFSYVFAVKKNTNNPITPASIELVECLLFSLVTFNN